MSRERWMALLELEHTALGAACFLACAVATLRTGHSSTLHRQRPLRALEQVIERRFNAPDGLRRRQSGRP
jgi:hypothetical protein